MNIKEYTKKDGTKVYRTNVYLGVDNLTGKQVRTSVSANSRKMCDIKARQAINKFINNGSTIARKKVVFDNFESLALSWVESYKLTVKANSIRSVKNYLKVYILPAIGTYVLPKITAMLLQGIVNDWSKNANTSEIISGKREKGKGKNYKIMLNIIKRILDYGVQLGAINDNPATKVFPPKLKTRTVKKIKYFDDKELKMFLEYLESLEPSIENQLHNALYRLLLATGLRIGEALALNWSDIDFSEKLVNVTKTTLQSREVQDSPKTKGSNRIISLDNATLQILANWRKFQNNHNKVIGLSDSVVFSYDGQRLIYESERVRLSSHLESARLPNIGLHGFRHTHASLLMNNDVNPKEIQERLGHSKITTTLDTYSHLAKDKKKETAEKFSNILKAL
ncbi:MAG: tyrosine-type recombinase/integrase [Lactococcus lactis]|uniref:tyrosine-type recombinase/integrase n=3 Tax=Bacillati TaxID=1783272 RepID=UPI00289D2AB6|nr:tyrosine-type recombinase/integrase [Lactococcus sp.]MCI8686448.1 site-specific integrase [Lactococcus lactis]